MTPWSTYCIIITAVKHMSSLANFMHRASHMLELNNFVFTVLMMLYCCQACWLFNPIFSVLNLIVFFLSDRSQSCKVSGYLSSFQSIEIQGSVLIWLQNCPAFWLLKLSVTKTKETVLCRSAYRQIVTHRRSITKRGECFQQRLFVCHFVCLSAR